MTNKFRRHQRPSTSGCRPTSNSTLWIIRRDAIRRYAEQNNMQVVRTYSDSGKSGLTMRLFLGILGVAGAFAQSPAGVGSWTPVAQTRSAPNVRPGSTSTVLRDGRVLVAGGGTRSLAIFDPKQKEWTTVPGQLSEPRSFHAAALLQDGKVLIAGGRDGEIPLNSTDLFDPATGTVTPSGFMAVARAGHSATALPGGKVLIAGGDAQASAELYDPEKQSFSATGPMSVARSGHAAILLPDNNEVLLAGGRGVDGVALASAEIYSPLDGVFLPAAPMGEAIGEPVVHPGRPGMAIVSSQAFSFPTVRAVWSERRDGSFTVDGKGWQPGEAVRLSFQGTEIGVTADAQGSFNQGFAGARIAEIGAASVRARGLIWHTAIHAKFDTSVTIDSQSCGVLYSNPSSYSVTVNGGYIFTPSGTVALLASTDNFATGADVAETDLSNGAATLSAFLTPGNYNLEIEYFGGRQLLFERLRRNRALLHDDGVRQ